MTANFNHHPDCPKCRPIGRTEIETFAFEDGSSLCVWNVTLAKLIVGKPGRDIYRLDAPEILRHIRHNVIQPQHVAHVNLNAGPVIIGSLNGEAILIDGNHRATRWLSEEADYIPAYILTEEENAACIMGTPKPLDVMSDDLAATVLAFLAYCQDTLEAPTHG